MDGYLQDLKTNWKTNSTFALLIEIYHHDTNYTIDSMVSDFISIVEHRMNKNMIQWRTHHLHFALAVQSFPAVYLARWFLGQGIPD